MIRRRTALAGAGALGLAGLAALVWRAPGRGAAEARSPDEPLGDFRAIPLEGPKVILDPARFPTRFNEPPMLAEAVRAGRLPPVAERVGQDPLVVQPVHEIGRYGGTIRRAFIGPGGDSQGVARFAAGPDSLLFWDYDWSTVRPNIAKAFAFSPDWRELTLSLRRGMRWSDGAPFTADDILFWYEDMYRDHRVVGAPSATLRVGGQDVEVRKLDDLTVAFVAAEPYPFLAEALAGYTDLGGPSAQGRASMGGFACRHYLSRFHPRYRSEQELTREAKAAGFASWAVRLKSLNDWTLNPDLPVVSPWRVVSPINHPTLTLERNPYSVWVDVAGNQLPYVDRIEHGLCASGELVSFKASTGRLDFQDRHLYVSKLPFLLKNRRRSNYRVFLDPFLGTDLGIRINLDHRKDAEIGALLSDATFRRALSLACDRDQLNETLMYGAGLPTAATPAPECKYYPGDEWARRWAAHDPAQANRLLDSIGLTARDSAGYRQRRDGKGRLRIQCDASRDFFDYVSAGEMIRDQWKAIGVDLDLQVLEGTLWVQRAMAGEAQLCLQNTGAEDPFSFPDFLFPSSPFASSAVIGVEFARWFRSDGRLGRRPPPEIREIMDLWRRGRAAPSETRIEIGREMIRRHVDLVLSIGLISGGLANYGLHVASDDLGNVPRRIINSPVLRSPANVLPLTFYFRNPSRREV